MAFRFTNLTQSNVNVPFNRRDKKPKHVVPPDGSVVLTAADLAALDVDVKDKLMTITSGPHPIFKVEEVSDAPVAVAPPAKKGKQKKAEAPVVEEVVTLAESVVETVGEEVSNADESSPVQESVS